MSVPYVQPCALCITVMLLTTSTAAIPPGDGPVQYSVTIEAATPVRKIRQTIIGIEVETTGHSIVGGGLSSQMLFDASFEDPKDDPLLPPATGNRPACSGPCHWTYSSEAYVVANASFSGNHSVLLKPSAQITSAGLYSRGLSLEAGLQYKGYFFAKAASGKDCTVTIGLIDQSGTNSTTQPLAVAASSDWTMVNFSLAYISPNSTSLGRFYVQASPDSQSAVLIDQIFLENADGLWRNGSMHLRGDVADALLLTDSATGEVGLQALRLNGG